MLKHTFLRPAILIAVAASVALSGSVTPTAHAANTARLTKQINLTYHSAGIAATAAKVFVGTSDSDQLLSFSASAPTSPTTIQVPDVGTQILTMGMERLAMAPNGSWLYIMNTVRQDIVAVDPSGANSAWRINQYAQHDGAPTDLKVAPDGHTLLVTTGTGVDKFDASNGNYLGTLTGASAATGAADGTIYYLTLGHNQGKAVAAIHKVNTLGVDTVLATYNGSSLAQLNGDIAVSPDGKTVFSLFADSFRAFDTGTGKQLGKAVSLAIAAQYRRIALAPNGKQVILYVPTVTNSNQPGSAKGAIKLIDVSKPAQVKVVAANLSAISSPYGVAYAPDSKHAFVSGFKQLDVIYTGY